MILVHAKLSSPHRTKMAEVRCADPCFKGQLILREFLQHHRQSDSGEVLLGRLKSRTALEVNNSEQRKTPETRGGTLRSFLTTASLWNMRAYPALPGLDCWLRVGGVAGSTAAASEGTVGGICPDDALDAGAPILWHIDGLVLLQTQLSSMPHVLLQPSPSFLLPSSHCSVPSNKPSPHVDSHRMTCNQLPKP